MSFLELYCHLIITYHMSGVVREPCVIMITKYTVFIQKFVCACMKVCKSGFTINNHITGYMAEYICQTEPSLVYRKHADSLYQKKLPYIFT